MSKDRTCCFFGHRKVANPEELKIKLYEIIEELITVKDVDTFLFGSKSEFDGICHAAVTALKEKYSHIRRVYVRAEYPYINEDYKSYLLQDYEDTYFPEHITGAGKATYVERNCEMIEHSSICVVYYNPDYTPPSRRASRRSLTDYQPKSGTRIAYEYAVKKEKHIINAWHDI